MATSDILKKYAGSKEQQPAKKATPWEDKVHGCGRCGSKEYQLTAANMWQCCVCDALYPFIAALETERPPVPVSNWVLPCCLCGNPWMMRHKDDHSRIFCPVCTTSIKPEAFYNLVWAGRRAV